ncbi:MAG: Mrp/NBP35 family ATP-binding protein [Phycisphaerae bacterium]|nr:Mrp/NBP35 family ATP-binding protein [Phycisphaerae bacterium]
MNKPASLTKETVLDALRTVQDPELHKDLVTLDMIRNVAVCDGLVRVHVELTTPACPLKDRMRSDVEAAVRRLDGVKQVEVEFSAQVRRGVMQQASLPGVKNILAIGAGKGGVGKSTVSVLTAIGLARAGAKVGLMDADVYGPSIPKMLGIENEKPAIVGEQIAPVTAHGLKIMSIGFMLAPEQAVIWRGPMIHGTIKQFLDQVDWGELDYLIVDLPPGTGDVPLTLSQSIPMTGAVVVCTPQDVALLDAMRAARMYQQLNVDVIGLVENMSYFIAPDTGKEYDLFGKGRVEKAAAKLNVPFLGSIPINIAVRVSGDTGTPEAVFEQSPQGVGEAVTRMVEALAAQISIRNAQRPVPVELRVHT